MADFSDIKIFSAMSQRLSYLGERQSVLAQNVANSDTPGYKPKDLKKVDFNELAKKHAGGGVSMLSTNPNHMSISTKGVGKFAIEIQKNDSVIIEDQMLKMSENALDYQITTSLYKKMTDLMKIAIDNNR